MEVADMLCQFTVKNYKSIRDEITFDMQAAAISEHDNKIIKDAKYMLNQNRNIDIFCIATRDGDYTSLASFLREHRKRVILLGPKNTSQKLKIASSKFISL